MAQTDRFLVALKKSNAMQDTIKPGFLEFSKSNKQNIITQILKITIIINWTEKVRFWSNSTNETRHKLYGTNINNKRTCYWRQLWSTTT